MMIHRYSCAVAALSVVAACGGGDGGTTVSEPLLDTAVATFDLLQQDNAEAFGRLGGVAPTPLDRMPNLGSATYSGSVIYSQDSEPGEIRSNPSAASRVQLTTNFSDASVNGRLFNFRSANPAESLSGELAMSGIISGNGVFGGLIPGVIDAPGGVNGTITVDGTTTAQSGVFGATFMGENHGALDGVVGFGPGGSLDTYGLFTAER